MDIDALVSRWPLDAWSIGPNTFRKITELVPRGSTILEFGSGPGTDLLAQFYTMKSIENDRAWLNKYKSTYFEVPLYMKQYEHFPSDPYWFDETLLAATVPTLGHYDVLLVDGPKGYRGGLYSNHRLFDFKHKIVIFDDVHCKDHRILMEMIAAEVGRSTEIYDEVGGKQFGVLV
jgi:hypothetical protein